LSSNLDKYTLILITGLYKIVDENNISIINNL
jgi:hypothetical protein